MKNRIHRVFLRIGMSFAINHKLNLDFSRKARFVSVDWKRIRRRDHMGDDERDFVDRSVKDRRSGYNRRQFSYAGHIPERRMGEERRSDFDRRNNEL